ncbi:MAG: undecaprenyldiphospho-muramoylpentapeptide beta-N-acetylglucosaminyltransferase [Rhodobiaceae bacterium]|nr:undecaprenyldiphospho-muramoylpentapeptide beta-N-acetylglucosaminyltransferase [Rhodobiaceae bacterium]MCC0040858.1 undecaprenyldiphospho-muramoylpentapeptide beta-N-acetylglucosaminyltransferase [Rhodobiaceae bacterium]
MQDTPARSAAAGRLSAFPVALLAAGGTGGHLFPAEALATVLTARGWRVELVTDTRVSGIGEAFAARAQHVVPSGTMSPRHPVRALRGALRLARGYLAARRLIGAVRPDVVVGFGGYPTLPPIVAAANMGVATVIHDQNAVMGRANRMLARHASGIATSFDDVKYLDPVHEAKVRRVGVPVRKAVLAAAQVPYEAAADDGPLRLLVFGGSQGARVMSEVVPAGLAALPADVRARLSLVQQCRAEDLDEARAIYSGAGIEAELAPFFTNLPQRMAQAHLVISRCGASTVAELGVIGRPAVLVPLPHALDQDQLYNGRAFAALGGGVVIEQSNFTPQAVTRLVSEAAGDPARLAAQAAAARRFGTPRAAEALADFVAEIAQGGRGGVSPA